MYCKCRNSAHNQGFGKSAKNIEVMEKVKKLNETKIKEPTTVCCLSIYHSGEKHFFVCADWLLQKWLANAIHLWAAKEASMSRIRFPTIFHYSDWLKKLITLSTLSEAMSLVILLLKMTYGKELAHV